MHLGLSLLNVCKLFSDYLKIFGIVISEWNVSLDLEGLAVWISLGYAVGMVSLW